MATPSEALAVKCLNKCSGRRRFVFKTFSQRIEEIDIDVYRSLNLSKAEPSDGSSFFRDCLIEYRELNTAEDFISLYEQIFPLVQTLPQIILQKEFIVCSLLSRLKMEARLSIEPILRLIAALSRDLLNDFIPFLQRIADSIEYLLSSGADRDAEIIEQIFTSWSLMMMYLQKYLLKDLDRVLSLTSKLRYYAKDYIRDFMAESMSYLLRKEPVQQLKKGIMNLMIEVAVEPSDIRDSSVGVLLSYVLRITPSRLHSKAETLMPLLLDDSTFLAADQREKGSKAVLQVLVVAFRRLYAELDSVGLALLWKCMSEKIRYSVSCRNSRHLALLLSLLCSVLKDSTKLKFHDTESIGDLVDMLVKNFIIPNLSAAALCIDSEVIDEVLKLMLCLVDGLPASEKVHFSLRFSSQWDSVFYLRSRSLLVFIEELLTKDSSIFCPFGRLISVAFDNLIEAYPTEVLYLMTIFCEKLEGNSSDLLDADAEHKHSKLHVFFGETLSHWISKISEISNGNVLPVPFQEHELAVLWGVVICFPHYSEGQTNPSILLDLINVIEQLLKVDAGISKDVWPSLIGATLRSYHKLMSERNISHEDCVIIRCLDLAKRYKLSPQVLSAVADVLDSVSEYSVSAESNDQSYLPEYVSGKTLDALNVFDENLFHASKHIRLSTLRILCHFEPISCDEVKEDSNGSQTKNVAISFNVFKLLRSIEQIDLSVSTSQKAILLISKIQTALSVRVLADQCLPAVLSGIIGIFNNRFSYLWSSAQECVTFIIWCHDVVVWDRYLKCLEYLQTTFLSSLDHRAGDVSNISKDTGLVGRFISYYSAVVDSTTSGMVLSLLVRCLQKVPSVAESHNRQLVPLFLKFLGYNVDLIHSSFDSSQMLLLHKGKEWKGVLKEWLSLFELFRNPKAFYQSQAFRDVLLHRLLDLNDVDIQMKVFECLLNWRDVFLLPYAENIKNLINPKSMRDELTKWSLSINSVHSIDVMHRIHVVPIVIRILLPKVTSLKMQGGEKNARVNNRRAVLGFLTQLQVDELLIFFEMLLKPLLCIVGVEDAYKIPFAKVDTSEILKNFNPHLLESLSWKKIWGFLHVIEDIISIFDEAHVVPFLDLLMNCVALILANCTPSLSSLGISESSSDNNCSIPILEGLDHDEVMAESLEKKDSKDFKALRSLCLKITYVVVNKYENYDFGSGFWDLFFNSVKPLITNFKNEGASGKNPSALFYCFLAMSKSYKLVTLLSREENLVADIISLVTVPTASESIVSSVLKFINNLLELDMEPGSDCFSLERVLLPNLDVLLSSLHSLFSKKNASKRQMIKFPGTRELTIFNLLPKYIKTSSEAEKFLDVLLPVLQKTHRNPDICVATLLGYSRCPSRQKFFVN